ncbi:MAG: NADH-quinone oxidoreductase subunit J [Candidatus Acidiferrales bacterium]
MVLANILFYIFATLAVGSAVMMVTRRNIVHAAVFLVTTLLATAGIFLQLQAEFLFVAQILLYAGGIMVLFIFVIMLVNLDVEMRLVQFNRQWMVAGSLAFVLGIQVLIAFWSGRNTFHLPVPTAALAAKNTESIADALFSHFLLPFEIASILLLVAMIGAVVMGKRRVE